MPASTQYKKNANIASKGLVKKFTVYSKAGEPMTFEHVLAIDTMHFSQLLSTGGKYNIYKLTKTTFVKSDYNLKG